MDEESTKIYTVESLHYGCWIELNPRENFISKAKDRVKALKEKNPDRTYRVTEIVTTKKPVYAI